MESASSSCPQLLVRERDHALCKVCNCTTPFLWSDNEGFKGELINRSYDEATERGDPRIPSVFLNYLTAPNELFTKDLAKVPIVLYVRNFCLPGKGSDSIL